MKPIICAGLTLLVATTADAQVFRPGVGNGSSHHSPTGSRDVGHGGWTTSHPSGHARFYWGGHGYDRGPIVSLGWWPGYYGGFYQDYGYSYGYYGVPVTTYGSYGLSYGSNPSYPTNAANGFWLGALAGAIIGHNSGSLSHNAWRGAAWGAGVGWLLGTVADVNRARVAYSPQPASTPVSVVQVAPQPVAISAAPAAPTTPMTAANTLFGR